MSKNLKIQGPVFSIITPFKKNGNIDYKILFKNLSYYYLKGVRLFYLMFFNGRIGLLNEKEVIILNKRIAKFLKKNFKDVIYIGAGKFEGSAKDTLRSIKHLSNTGVDMFSVIFGEKYYNDDQVYSYFKYLNNKTPIPLTFHLQMMMNGHGIKPPIVNYSIGLADKICSLNKVIAVKEDSKIHNFTRKIIPQIKKKVNVIRAGGGMTAWRKYKKIGCQSWLVGIELLDPSIAFDFDKALREKNLNYLNFIEKKIEKPFFNEVKKYGWHIFIKSCLEICGFMKRYERLPLKHLSNRNHYKIKKFLDKLRKTSKNRFGKEYFKRVKI
tara:strand:+ start:1466 stop:2440 length:975 start_codon:yes stop_codon:yes gene_type:complete